jgi:3-deoxy-D-arabino-heptulosonate 7-phosphate (DAHP) synthase class II
MLNTDVGAPPRVQITDTATSQQAAVGGFASPQTRMLLAGNGLTTPVLEAATGTALRVRVLRQDYVSAEQIPDGVADEVRLVSGDRVVVRRTCLVDPQMTPVSVNLVIAILGSATAQGIDDVDTPIGYSLIAAGVSQQRRNVRAGLARWPDGRVCVAKAYIVLLDDQPVCYIRETFNPSVISPDLADASCRESLDHTWNDDPAAVSPVDCSLNPAFSVTERPALQQPPWPDPDAAHQRYNRLRTLPPLVSLTECDQLTDDLAAAVDGQSFVLVMGDCAETFSSCNVDSLVSRQALAAAAASVLTYGSGRPAVTIGRIAGQYAKPRSNPIDAATGMVAYFGDMVNTFDPDPASRVPNPHRMVEAYFHSAATMNHLRTHPLAPGAAVTRLIRRAAGVCPDRSYANILADMAHMFDLAVTAPPHSRALRTLLPELRIAHEALVLGYEHALTRHTADDRWWGGSAHLLWIGERTRQSDHAHIEWARNIANPVAVKLGSAASPDDIAHLCRVLNPEKIPGRLTLTPRLGVQRAQQMLPAFFDAAAATGTPVCWVCDPMHANTHVVGNGRKTRRLDDITSEIQMFFHACRETGTVPGGLHLESTADDVTECIGGWQQFDEDDLARDYRTCCDPRLNDIQTIHCVTVAVQELSRQAGRDSTTAHPPSPPGTAGSGHVAEANSRNCQSNGRALVS